MHAPSLRPVARELAGSAAFSAVAAATFTALGFLGTAACALVDGRTGDAVWLNEREVLAIAVPSLLAAWAWCVARRWMMRSNARTAGVTFAVATAAALANRFILVADVEDAFARGASFTEKAGALVATTIHGGLARAFDSWREELANPGSLLWFSVYGVAIAVGVALALRRAVRTTAVT